MPFMSPTETPVSIMCKHVLNAQVSVRASCCKKWFDCPECHDESEAHQLKKSTEIVMACKKCKKVFRKDLQVYDESDEYCPHCDNHYVLDAVTPQLQIGVETDDLRINANFIRDERMKRMQHEAPLG